MQHHHAIECRATERTHRSASVISSIVAMPVDISSGRPVAAAMLDQRAMLSSPDESFSR